MLRLAAVLQACCLFLRAKCSPYVVPTVDDNSPDVKPSEVKRASKFGWLRTSTSSAFLLVVFCLLAVDVGLTAVLPSLNRDWFDRSISGSHEPFCKKVFEYITSYNEPEVLVVGSSLAGVPAMTCDEIILHGHDRYPVLPNMFAHSHYDQAEFFQKSLEEQSGKKVKVVNLGLAGAVVSDYLLILEKAFEMKKKPALVVCAIAPAEFLWNDGRGVEKTRIRTAFKSYLWPTSPAWYELVFNKCWREVRWNYDAAQHVLAQSRQELVSYLAEVTHHPEDMYTAMNKQKADGDEAEQAAEREAKEKAAEKDAADKSLLAKARAYRKAGKKVPVKIVNTLDDLPLYRKRYAALDMKLFAQHMGNFEQMLKLCRDSGQPLIVVNMPLTKENKAILNQKVAQRYYDRVAALTKQYGVPYVDMDTPNTYSLDDYYDSVHLNELGGRKFFTSLSKTLDEQMKLNQLCAARDAKNL